jgi:uncharacterized protein (DUF427 family)
MVFTPCNAPQQSRHSIDTQIMTLVCKEVHMTTEAFWKGQKIASTDSAIAVEGNAYFPPEAVDMRFLKPSARTSVCPWKGTAGYYDVVVNGETNADAAWVYAAPKQAAAPIANYIAFWKGVEVKGDGEAKPMAR